MARAFTNAQLNILIKPALASAIREAGSLPSGHFYAHVMQYLSLDQYQSVINDLVAEGKVDETNFLLTWKGSDAKA